jgi:2-phospho-L-lactate guanylyltransferase
MSGGTVVLVPIRSLTGGKTRLAGALTPEARASLTRSMLTRVVGAAVSSGVVQTVLVISPDPAVLHLAAGLDERVVAVEQNSGAPGLNGTIEQGRSWAMAHRAGAFLVLFGDLPLLDADDVRHLVRRDAPVVIAPDRHGAGTNALLLRFGAFEEDQEPFRFGFGVGSYAHHVDEAHRLGLDVAVSLTPGTSLDLDTPDDLAAIFGEAFVGNEEDMIGTRPLARVHRSDSADLPPVEVGP